MEQIREIFIENVKTLLDLRGWTQPEAAKACGMPLATFQSILYGKLKHGIPRSDLITKLAKGFGVEEWVLFSAAIEKAGFLSKMPRELLILLDSIYLKNDELQIRAIESVLRGFAVGRELELLKSRQVTTQNLNQKKK